jgi:nucleotide-binding universal stress UspA family protein
LPKFSDWVYEAAFFSHEDLFQEIENTKKKSLSKIDRDSKKRELGLKPVLLEGIASEEIIKYADENDCDIILAGRRGISEIEEILIGSTTSRLIRNSHKPVMVIPKTKRDVKIERIMAPVDFNEMSLLELHYSIFMARALGAKLYVVHISEFFNYRLPALKRHQLIEKINQKIQKIADDYGYEIEKIIYDEGEPAQKIIEISKKKKIDLVVMTTRQRSGFEKFFLGSITEKVLMYSNTPTLILPPPDVSSK